MTLRNIWLFWRYFHKFPGTGAFLWYLPALAREKSDTGPFAHFFLQMTPPVLPSPNGCFPEISQAFTQQNTQNTFAVDKKPLRILIHKYLRFCSSIPIRLSNITRSIFPKQTFFLTVILLRALSCELCLKSLSSSLPSKIFCAILFLILKTVRCSFISSSHRQSNFRIQSTPVVNCHCFGGLESNEYCVLVFKNVQTIHRIMELNVAYKTCQYWHMRESFTCEPSEHLQGWLGETKYLEYHDH